MSVIITLSDASANELRTALAGAQPSNTTTPATQPSDNVMVHPNAIIPPQVATRKPIVTTMKWANGATRIISGRLDEGSVWIIPFQTGIFKTGRFAGGEYLDQQCQRNVMMLRNRDGVVIYNGVGSPTTSPSINFQSSPPLPRSGKTQLDQNESYTLAIWNIDGEIGSHQLFMELYFQM